MLTLNQIKYKLIEWFKNHAQINNVTYESDFNFNAERNLTYPVVNIEYKDSLTSDKLLSHLYVITIADLFDANIAGHDDEILNDCILIAEDFLTWLQYQEEGLIFSKSSSIQPFYSDTHDRVTGINLGFTISVIRSQNICATPYVVPPANNDLMVGPYPIYTKRFTNRQTVDYTIQSTDRDLLIEMDLAIDNNLTVPNNSTVPLKKGTVVAFTQYGIGQTTVLGEAGVIIRSAGNRNKTYEQFSYGLLIKIDTNEWFLSGDLI